MPYLLRKSIFYSDEVGQFWEMKREFARMGVRGVKNHVFGPMGGCSGPMTFILGQDEIYT